MLNSIQLYDTQIFNHIIYEIQTAHFRTLQVSN